MNDYYNKESHGGNISPKGHFKYKHLEATMRRGEPGEHRYIRRHYPNINPPLEQANSLDEVRQTTISNQR